MLKMPQNISCATIRNWNRLNTKADGRLTKRANKTDSRKKILPREYFSDENNIYAVKSISDLIDENNFEILGAIFSLCINFLADNGVLNKSHVQKFLADYKQIKIIDSMTKIFLPKNEFDILGLIYQSLIPEGKKNLIGSYYTPQKISSEMTRSFSFDDGQKFLDPCCGSGSYLLTCKTENPENLFGTDNDPIAVMIAKTNLLAKFKKISFTPQIFCVDYLKESGFQNTKFDYIATNPPWGAVSKNFSTSAVISSGESFSHFYVESFNRLKPGGIIKFLLPESILKVKIHRDIRNFILSNGALEKIKIRNNSFSGVVTKYVEVSARNSEKKSCLKFVSSGKEKTVDTAAFYLTKNLIFNPLSKLDMKILEKINRLKFCTLEKSVWALGIVTGDNKKKLFDSQIENSEAIYTGKEILPYVLKPPKKFVVFDRSQLQQAAKTEIYRADEKLVYKFISNKPIFAYDSERRLFLNSANILIPNIQGMSIKTVMAFLNSPLYQYLYMKLFGELKILRGNLSELPFPKISKEIDAHINGLAEKYIACQNLETLVEIHRKIYEIFSLLEQEREYIGGIVDGKIDF